MSKLDELCKKRLDDLVEMIKRDYIHYFHKGRMDNPLQTMAIYDSDDKLYEIRLSIYGYDKHSCKDCIFLNGLDCLKGFMVSDWHYCRSYKTHKSCWDCKHWQNYGEDESWCSIDIERIKTYSYKDNKDNKCPNWEWKGW